LVSLYVIIVNVYVRLSHIIKITYLLTYVTRTLGMKMNITDIGGVGFPTVAFFCVWILCATSVD